jgi:hypothetical protein
VQIMSDLVDGAMLGLGEGARLVKGVYTLSTGSLPGTAVGSHTFFEKETHFVARLQKILIAYMVCAVVATGGELGHWVVV